MTKEEEGRLRERNYVFCMMQLGMQRALQDKAISPERRAWLTEEIGKFDDLTARVSKRIEE